MPSAEFLLIDNSNSFTKLALSTRERLGPVRRVRTSELDAASLRRVLRGWRFERVVLCSVVPKKAALLRAELAGKPLHNVDHRSNLGVGVAYPKPKTIG